MVKMWGFRCLCSPAERPQNSQKEWEKNCKKTKRGFFFVFCKKRIVEKILTARSAIYSCLWRYIPTFLLHTKFALHVNNTLRPSPPPHIFGHQNENHFLKISRSQKVCQTDGRRYRTVSIVMLSILVQEIDICWLSFSLPVMQKSRTCVRRHAHIESDMCMYHTHKV